MNRSLQHLWSLLNRDDEETVAIVEAVYMCDNGPGDPAQHSLMVTGGPAVCHAARRVIENFTSRAGRFNLDHVAWQLGIDITAEGPRIPDDDHICTQETLQYDGHVTTEPPPSSGQTVGVIMTCRACGKEYTKIGNTFYPSDEIEHVSAT